MKIFKRLIKVLEYIIIAILIILIFSGLIYTLKKYAFKQDSPQLLGFSFSIVVSGSMEPEINIDDVVIAREKKSYEIGDIITYKSGNIYITHRIVDINDNGYITKGDANNIEDFDTVEPSQISGKIILIIPRIGSLLSWLQTTTGKILSYSILIALLLIIFIARKSNGEN